MHPAAGFVLSAVSHDWMRCRIAECDLAPRCKVVCDEPCSLAVLHVHGDDSDSVHCRRSTLLDKDDTAIPIDDDTMLQLIKYGSQMYVSMEHLLSKYHLNDSTITRRVLTQVGEGLARGTLYVEVDSLEMSYRYRYGVAFSLECVKIELSYKTLSYIWPEDGTHNPIPDGIALFERFVSSKGTRSDVDAILAGGHVLSFRRHSRAANDMFNRLLELLCITPVWRVCEYS